LINTLGDLIMTNRTIQFYGAGYGAEPVSITATANGNTVFNGTINTINEPFTTAWLDPAQFTVIFTMEIPVEFSGTVPMSVTVNSGNGIAFAHVRSNYMYMPNPIYSSEQWAVISANAQSAESLTIQTSLANPPFSQAELDTLSNPATTQEQYYTILNAHGLIPYIMGGPGNFSAAFWPSDSRTDVTIDGNPVSPPNPRPPEYTGDWTWKVSAGSTLAFTFNTEAGIE